MHYCVLVYDIFKMWKGSRGVNTYERRLNSKPIFPEVFSVIVTSENEKCLLLDNYLQLIADDIFSKTCVVMFTKLAVIKYIYCWQWTLE